MADPGIIAMYEDDNGRTNMLDENNFDKYGQDYDQDKYIKKNRTGLTLGKVSV